MFSIRNWLMSLTNMLPTKTARSCRAILLQADVRKPTINQMKKMFKVKGGQTLWLSSVARRLLGHNYNLYIG